jgi:phenylpyruvate tautomerase PptA (4-oxalocrotonate tautomerase family)
MQDRGSIQLENPMPLVHLSVPSHLPAAQVRALADAVHEGLVATCHISPGDRFQTITRHAADELLIDPTYPNVSRSRNASIVEIKLLAGRTEAQKRDLYRYIVEAAAPAGVAADDVFIALFESALIDWSPGRGEVYQRPALHQADS